VRKNIVKIKLNHFVEKQLPFTQELKIDYK